MFEGKHLMFSFVSPVFPCVFPVFGGPRQRFGEEAGLFYTLRKAVLAGDVVY